MPLSRPVIDALMYWPRLGGTPAIETDVGVLVPLFNELLDRLPWWNRDWRVIEVRPGYPFRMTSGNVVEEINEVDVPGTLGTDAGATLPLTARVRFTGDRLLRFEVKAGAAVITPGLAAPGEREPHPFGAVLAVLMQTRRISHKELAMRCGRAMSTIAKVLRGCPPTRRLAAELATALDMPKTDLFAIAGLEPPAPED